MPLFWVPAISGVTEEFSPECPGASILLGAEGGLGDTLSTHNLHLCEYLKPESICFTRLGINAHR